MNNISFPSSIEVKTQSPLEIKRGPVERKSDLINPETWSYDIDDNGNKVFYVYRGMIVPCIATQDIYMLIDVDKILDESYLGWKLISGGGGNFIYDGGDAQSTYIHEQLIDAGTAIE